MDPVVTRKLAPTVGLGLLMVLLTGCLADIATSVGSKILEKAFEPGATEVEISLEAAKDVNPDYAGTPSPIVVRIYELKSQTAFMNADFWALYDGDTAVLGDDVQRREERQLKPGDKFDEDDEDIPIDRRRIDWELKEGSHFIGVLAAYQEIGSGSVETVTWRAVAETPAHETTELDVTLERLGVKIVEK